MSEYAYPLQQHLIDDFQRDGFVVTPVGLDDHLLALYGALVDKEIAHRTADDHRTVDEKNRYEQSFVQCMRLWETVPELVPFTCDPGLASMAAQLLDVASVRLWQDQALYKEPGGADTTPHQDQTFWPIGTEKLVSVWIPFEDVTIESGAMAYVPGSHLAGRLQVVDITHTSEPYAILDDPALAGRKPQTVEVKAGQAIWHHGMTVHQAAANTTTQTRRVFTIVYIDSAAKRHREWPTYPLDRDGVGVGELIAGPGMPVLWPAPAEMPNPPDVIGVATGPQYKVPE